MRGYPVYVVDKSITGGMKFPRWKARSSRCMFVGLSDRHSIFVPLVLNLATGTITPQHHVVFDDLFATVVTSADEIPDFNDPAWRNLFGESAFQYLEHDSEHVEVVRDNTLRHQLVSRAFDRERLSTPLQLEPLAHQHQERSTPSSFSSSGPSSTPRKLIETAHVPALK